MELGYLVPMDIQGMKREKRWKIKPQKPMNAASPPLPPNTHTVLIPSPLPPLVVQQHPQLGP